MPEYLREGLRVVSVGLNPSPISVRAGFYFANPRNRFGPALNASGLAPEPFTPDAAAQKKLFSRYGISFTDLVKRASRGGAQLRVGDYWTGAPQLKGKLLHYRPQAAWFHGKMAYGQFRKHTGGALPATIEWEFQTGLIGTSRIFVTPNPSPAHAAFSLAALTHWYKPPCGRTQPPLIAIRGLLLTPRAALHFPHLV